MAKVKNKKRSSADAAQKKRNKESSKKALNPFEVHINKDKQKVLGRKNKADHGLPGVARTKAINKRKNTLLQEYKSKDKDNVFVDRRIGEKNANLTQEEKAMARFAAERVKSHRKKNIFNLNDEEVLTHGGQTLEEIEKFEDPKSEDEFSDEDNLDGRLDKKFVGEAHFGGGILSKKEGTMSRKDLIDQLIVESKKRKAEKQKIREETINDTEKLDSEWKDLLPLMATAKKKEEGPQEKIRADDYDIAVRELKYESRATPSDKLKSEEEIMRAEKEKLEELEEQRLARMKGFSGDSDSKTKHKSADDLDDDYVVEDINEEILAYDEDGCVKGTDKNSLGQSQDSEGDDEEQEEDEELSDDDSGISAKPEISQPTQFGKTKLREDKKSKNVEAEEEKDNDDDEDEDDDDDDGGDDDDDDLSDLKVSESSSEDEDTPEEKKSVDVLKATQKIRSKTPNSELETKENGEYIADEKKIKEIKEDLRRRKIMMEKARTELPYTFTAPENFEDLEKLLKDQSPEYQSIILERIIKCNHWTLGQGNKEKLCNLFNFLLQHIMESAAVDTENDILKCFQILDSVCPHLYDLAQISSHNAATCVQNILREKHDEFKDNQKKYPDLQTLIIFKIVSLLFPTSDFRHPVVSPSLVFMSQILLRCRVKSRSDIAKGLFVSALVLEYTTMSKRFSPSAINFLRGILFLATPKPLPMKRKVVPPFKKNSDSSDLLIPIEAQKNRLFDVENACMKAGDLLDGKMDEDFKLRAFVTALNMINEFKKQLEELEAAFVIFSPIIDLWKTNSFKKYPRTVSKHAKKILEEFEALAERKLEYIIREKKKPKALRLYEPRIEHIYDGKKHRPMSREKADREKLLHKIKKETKSAIREVRRDRAFLAKVQINEQLKSDAERKRKVKEIYGEASAQQGELNEMKRKK